MAKEHKQPSEAVVARRESELVALVKAANDGDSAAMEEIVMRFRPLVLTVARRYQHISYEDAVQEAYLALIQCVQNYDANRGVPFTGYVNLKLRGDVRTALRRLWQYDSRTVHPQPSDDPSGQPDIWDLGGVSITGEDTFSLAEWMVVLQQVGLSQRETLGLVTLMEGSSSTEVAKHEHVSAETVKTWRKRGIAKVRKALMTIED